MKLAKQIFNLIAFTSILFFAIACSSDDNSTSNTNNPTTPTNPSSSINKIMPLGASRVAGARPEYESFRYELWKRLIDGGFTFDFIGTETDPASYPMYNGQSFDIEHEGRGGITSTGILQELSTWLTALGTQPDIVLFSSPGGNDGADVLPQTLSNIRAIVDILQTNNPNVTIFLELPAPPLTNEQTPEFTVYYNNALQGLAVIATEKTTATSSVLTIDMATNFIDAYLADDVHYNEAGASFIANRYFNALTPILQ